MSWSVSIHPGDPLEPHDLWSAWNTDPALLIPLALSVLIYATGLWNVWRRAGAGHGVSTRGWVSFVGAMVGLTLALVSPLDALGGALFSAHMTQHMILMLIAAPLLVMSDFPVALFWALPRRLAKPLGQGLKQSHAVSRAWRVVSGTVPAWLLFAVTLWIWHLPSLYEAALRNEALHDLEHVLFLVAGMLFWWALFKRTTQKHVQYGHAIPYLFTTVLHSGVLGALMTFTARPWYSYYTALTPAWGLTPLEDQQLAGLIMWIPGGAVFTLMTIGYFAAWLRALEQRSLRVHPADSLRTRQEPNS